MKVVPNNRVKRDTLIQQLY